tara:strand:- start:8747 stop:9778 length:1032 start_codon:yes stop_codon:yes gene_type:complete
MYGEFAFCNAPFNNMYFNTLSKVAPCWKLPGFVDTWSKDRSINDIWNGEHFQKYRDALLKNKFLTRCKECKHETDNGIWPLAKAYSELCVNKNGYPSLIEIEVSNQCNLECIMCSPLLSNGLAKKANIGDHRGMLEPYDNSFREQLKEYYPHLKEFRINGGEPFAQKLVLDICEDIAEINPSLRISFATNGTVMNKRVRHILDICNIQINISIDSLIPERYSKIRVNGDLNKVLVNLEIFKDHCKKKDTQISVMVNPMRNNWEEMPLFLDFCHKHDLKLWFNTIRYPTHLSIWNLPTNELKVIYTKLSAMTAQRKKLNEYNKLRHLVEDQIANWLMDSHIQTI